MLRTSSLPAALATIGEAMTRSRKKIVCGLCQRNLKRDKEGNLLSVFSPHTKTNYCPPRDWERCHSARKRLDRIEQ